MRGFSANGTFLYKYTFPLQKGKLTHSVLKQLEIGKVFFFFLMLSLLILHCRQLKKEFLILFSSKEVVWKRGCFWISCSGTLHLKLSGLVEVQELPGKNAETGENRIRCILWTCVYWAPTRWMRASLVAWMVKHPPAMQETRVWSLGREDPLEKAMATHSSILPRESHGQRSLVGYSPWGCKESDTTEQLSGGEASSTALHRVT